MSSACAAVELLEREQPLLALQAAARAAGGGQGCTVLVTGEAGIGKSSLLRQWVRVMEGARQILWGACDDLFSPRPLGPLRDIAGKLDAGLLHLLDTGAAAARIFSALHECLRRSVRLTVLVFEDVHWADEATLDLIRFLGRRVAALPCLLLLSYRDDEIDGRHPLHQVLADLPPQALRRVALSPLSPQAVSALAAKAGRPDAGLHEATGGNPFYVTEVLDSGIGDAQAGVPSSVRDAVCARLSRLEAAEREVLNRLSLLPGAAPLWLVRAWLGPALLPAVDRCASRGLLVCAEGLVSFRHVLARRATADALAPLWRGTLHAEILALLERPPAGMPAVALSQRLHHAEQAGDAAQVLRLAPLAAGEAAAVGAHREAAKHWDCALRFAEQATREQLAGLYEGWSYEAGLSAIDTRVIAARLEAVKLWAELGRNDKLGDNLRCLSRLYWYLGEGELAGQHAEQAVTVLEAIAPCPELAWAYATRAQLFMLRDCTEPAIEWGLLAIELAQSMDGPEILCHALNSVGTAELFAGRPGGRERLERSLEIALAHGYDEQAARVYSNASEQAVVFKEFRRAEPLLLSGIAFDRQHDLDAWTHYLQGWLAQLRMEQGRLDEAEQIAAAVLAVPRLTVVMRLPALTVLARVHMRRGAADARGLLQEALRLALGTGEAQRIVPAVTGLVEQAWLQADLPACCRALAPLDGLDGLAVISWAAGEVAVWRRRAGLPPGLQACGAGPWDLELQGDAAAAAAAWAALEAPNEAALALLQAALERPGEQGASALPRALQMFEAAGHVVGAARVRGLARELGLQSCLPRAARGHYGSARAHRYGLTARQQQVLAMICAELSNSEIGALLGLSRRTVEHHVSGLLAKLEVADRGQARQLARREGL